MDDDLSLLERWRGGDRAAGNALFDRHFDRVYRFFRHKIAGEVGDLVQRTFLGCVEAKERFRADSSFRTYLFAVARHELYAHFRTTRRMAETEIGSSSLLDLGPSPNSVLLERREERVLLEALRTLPLELQLVIELYYWEGMRGPELAIVLDVPEGTARSRLRRAIQALRERLDALEGADLGSTSEDLDGWAESLALVNDALGAGE